MIFTIIKLFYALPVLRINMEFSKWSFKFHARIVKRDSRSFEWFLERRKYGFDERELWGLSQYFLEKLSKIVNSDDPETISLREVVSIANNRNIDFVNLIKWFIDRVNLYNKWECPLSIYEKRGHIYYLYTNEEAANLSSTFENVLAKYINSEPLTKEEKRICLKMFNRYGW